MFGGDCAVGAAQKWVQHNIEEMVSTSQHQPCLLYTRLQHTQAVPELLLCLLYLTVLSLLGDRLVLLNQQQHQEWSVLSSGAVMCDSKCERSVCGPSVGFVNAFRHSHISF
jgi:hypothetical protein